MHYMTWMIDTLRYVKALEEVGVDRKVAECQAEALSQVLECAAQTILATKEDLRKTEGNLHADMQLLKEDLRGTEISLHTEIQLLELRLTKLIHASMIKTISILAGFTAFMGGMQALLDFY